MENGSFPCAPLSNLCPPPVTEHVSLHIKPLCKKGHVLLGGANNMLPLSSGTHKENIQKLRHTQMTMGIKNSGSSLVYYSNMFSK